MKSTQEDASRGRVEIQQTNSHVRQDSESNQQDASAITVEKRKVSLHLIECLLG